MLFLVDNPLKSLYYLREFDEVEPAAPAAEIAKRFSRYEYIFARFLRENV